MEIFGSISVNVLYLVLLILGLIYALFLLISGQVGGHDFDGGADLHVDTDIHIGVGDHGAGADSQHGISPISPLTIATFITAFGATGLVATSLFSASGRGSLVWATLGGVVFSALTYVGFTYLFIKPQGSSEVRIAELAGKKAEVITPIPLGGIGEIAFIAQGGRVTYSARNKKGLEIARGTTVTIESIVGGIAYVEPFVE